MTEATDKVRLGFTQGSRAWYAATGLAHLSPSEFDEFMLGDYPEDGGTTGEFSITFGRFSDREPCYARVKVFDENLALFDSMTSLKEFIKARRCTSPEALRAFLVGEGFVDLTTETCPEPTMAHRKSGLAKLDKDEIEALMLDPKALVPEAFR